MLANAYILAKIGADTAGNERNFPENYAARAAAEEEGQQPERAVREAELHAHGLETAHPLNLLVVLSSFLLPHLFHLLLFSNGPRKARVLGGNLFSI